MRKLKLTSLEFKADPHRTLAEAMELGSFAEIKIPLFGPVQTALKFDAAQTILKRADLFALDARNAGYSRAFGLPFIPKSLRLLSENILSLDDPDHRRLRRCADAPFRRAAIEANRDRVSMMVDRYLDQIAARKDPEIDLVETVFRPLPLQVISDLLGLTDGARERLTKTIAGFSEAASTLGILRALMGMGGLIKQLREEIELARRDPKPGLLSALIHTEESDEGQMSEDELLSLVLVLFVAGHDTTTNLLSSGLYTLKTEPGAWETAQTLDADGWRIAVDELMRYAMPVHMTKPRFVIEDTELSGVTFKRGDKVVALIGAANLDPSEFDDPLKLDLTRRPNRHLGWGGGAHICLGLHLAKMETELVLSKIVQRWPDLTFGRDLKWSKRIGTRGLTAMPVHLAP